MEIITLRYAGGESIPVELTRKRMKHIRLRVLSGGRVLLSAPLFAARDRIDAFLDEHKEWVYRHYSEKSRRLGYIEMPFILESGEAYYLGVKRKIVGIASTRDSVEIGEREIIVRYKGRAERLARVYMNHIARAAKYLFTRAMERWLPLFSSRGVNAPKIKVRRYRSKWGACFYAEGEIVMNLHLIKADPIYTDYVMLHELTHFLYHGHGKRFYAFLLRAMPDARERKRMLNAGVPV
ncbi:MAG: DUF45 domain-containing protein [Clostridia bacterium]|nr:DUF45 domain-containing protein [Clostridia bacterium]